MNFANPLGLKFWLNRFGFWVILLCGILAAAGGRLVSPLAPTMPSHCAKPGVIMVGDPELLQAVGSQWRDETSRRFPNAVVLLCHGQDLSGVFFCFPDGTLHSGLPVDVAMGRLQEEYSGRIVVCLACNPEHILVRGHPGCYYSTASTWQVPDRSTADPDSQAYIHMLLGWPMSWVMTPQAQSRWEQDPSAVGSIYELVEAN